MGYSRDYYLPGIQRDVNNPGSKVVGPERAQCIQFLQDDGLAYSHLARIAAVIASDSRQSAVTANFSIQAMIFKSKSMALLRERLVETPQDPKMYNQVLLLMNAELYERYLDAASSHARILVSLLQNGTIKADPAFLFKVVYHDAQRAAMSLTRTLFNLEEWVPQQLGPLNSLIRSRLPPVVGMEAAARGLNPILDVDPPLKHTLTSLKHAYLCLLLLTKDNCWKATCSSSSMDVSTLLLQWAA